MQICTRLRWRNAMFKKRRFRIVWSDSLNLPVLSLLCAWARHLKTCTQRSQAICTSVLAASKLLLIKKYIILTPCTSTQRKLENEQRKSYRILISSCWTTDSRFFDFYRKRELGPDKSHYKQSRLWSRLQTTLAQIIRITRVVHGTYLSVPFPSHSNLCLSHPVRFPLHYYNIDMEYNTIKIIIFMKV